MGGAGSFRLEYSTQLEGWNALSVRTSPIAEYQECPRRQRKAVVKSSGAGCGLPFILVGAGLCQKLGGDGVVNQGVRFGLQALGLRARHRVIVFKNALANGNAFVADIRPRIIEA